MLVLKGRGDTASGRVAKGGAARIDAGRRRFARAEAARVLVASCVALFAAASDARADVRVRLRDTYTTGTRAPAGRTYESTLYLKGSLQRRDIKSRGPKDGREYLLTLIDDCARQKLTWMDAVNRRYWVYSGGVPAQAFAAFNELQFPPVASPKTKGTLTETVTITDTGERREMFGLAARRLRTVTTWSAEPDSCDAKQGRVETDGWYVDLLYGVDCSPDLSGATPSLNIYLAGSRCLNRRLLSQHYAYRRQYAGDARLGFPLSETQREYDVRGRLFSTESKEVLELSTDPLDDALFAVPAGYALAPPPEVRKPSLLSRALSIFR